MLACGLMINKLSDFTLIIFANSDKGLSTSTEIEASFQCVVENRLLKQFSCQS